MHGLGIGGMVRRDSLKPPAGFRRQVQVEHQAAGAHRQSGLVGDALVEHVKVLPGVLAASAEAVEVRHGRPQRRRVGRHFDGPPEGRLEGRHVFELASQPAQRGDGQVPVVVGGVGLLDDALPHRRRFLQPSRFFQGRGLEIVRPGVRRRRFQAPRDKLLDTRPVALEARPEGADAPAVGRVAQALVKPVEQGLGRRKVLAPVIERQQPRVAGRPVGDPLAKAAIGRYGQAVKLHLLAQPTLLQPEPRLVGELGDRLVHQLEGGGIVLFAAENCHLGYRRPGIGTGNLLRHVQELQLLLLFAQTSHEIRQDEELVALDGVTIDRPQEARSRHLQVAQLQSAAGADEVDVLVARVVVLIEQIGQGVAAGDLVPVP